MGKLSVACEALRDYLKTAASRNVDQEKSIELLKQELADFEINVTKKETNL